MTDLQSRKEEGIEKAMERFLLKSGLIQAAIARILGDDPGNVGKAKQGIRPYAPMLARLYLLTQDEAFAPKSDLEKEVYEREKANPPLTLKEYLEKGKVPSSERSDKVKAQNPQPPVPKPSPPKAEVSEGAVESALKVVCALLGTDLAELHRLVQSTLERGKGSNPPAASKTSVSPCFDLVLSGAADIKGQDHDGVRFVLTSGAFKRFEGQFTQPEIEDTKRLVQELRRRLNISAQLTDMSVRVRIGRALVREINELYLAIELCKEAVPSGAASRINQARVMFQSIQSTSNEGNDNGE